MSLDCVASLANFSMLLALRACHRSSVVGRRRVQDLSDIIADVAATLRRSWLDYCQHKAEIRARNYKERNRTLSPRASPKKMLKRPTLEENLWKAAVSGAAGIASTKAVIDAVLEDKADLLKEVRMNAGAKGRAVVTRTCTTRTDYQVSLASLDFTVYPD